MHSATSSTYKQKKRKEGFKRTKQNSAIIAQGYGHPHQPQQQRSDEQLLCGHHVFEGRSQALEELCAVLGHARGLLCHPLYVCCCHRPAIMAHCQHLNKVLLEQDWYNYTVTSGAATSLQIRISHFQQKNICTGRSERETRNRTSVSLFHRLDFEQRAPPCPCVMNAAQSGAPNALVACLFCLWQPPTPVLPAPVDAVVQHNLWCFQIEIFLNCSV